MKDKLVHSATRARDNAYAPYSKFLVGAAVSTESGRIYTGCNIENSSYSLTCCAERIALFKALSEGETHFTGMAVVADTDGPVRPCGACRQVMAEFFTNDIPVFLANLTKDVNKVRIMDLLPDAFNAEQLKDQS